MAKENNAVFKELAFSKHVLSKEGRTSSKRWNKSVFKKKLAIMDFVFKVPIDFILSI